MEEEYEDYLSLTQRTQTELLETIDELRTLEGWDADCIAGLRRWAADEGMVFRALRVSPVFHNKSVHSLAEREITTTQ